MSDLLLTTWAGAGTTPPLRSVVRSLVERGHTVRVLGDEMLRGDFESVGAEHIAWTRAPQRPGHGRDADFIGDWEASDGIGALGRVRDRLSVGPAGLFAADVLEEIERRRPDALLTEVLLFGPLIAAEAAGVPAVVLNATINIVPAPGVPPFGMGFLPATTPEEQQRDLEAAAGGMALWDAALPELNAARAELGLDLLEHVLEQGRSAARVLVLTSRAFDFLGEFPPTVKHVGPRLEDLAGSTDWQPPAGDGPLVLVALSSDFQDQAELLQRIVDGLGATDVRAVVTTGHGLAPDAVRAPANVQVVATAPHMAILAEAALTVTHAGHGTVIKSLAAGVPLVCLPMGRDQLDVAARVVHAGAGVRLDRDAAPEQIADAARTVLADPAFRAAAERIAAVVAEETATDLAVAEIEAVSQAGSDSRVLQESA